MSAGEFRARVPAGSITGWLAGDGPPVLVLHGGPGLSDYTASLAAELEDAFGVIRSLPALTVPALFVLGAASPIPARHGIASAGLIPGARYQIEDCGHFPWLERPGSVRKALDRICG